MLIVNVVGHATQCARRCRDEVPPGSVDHEAIARAFDEHAIAAREARAARLDHDADASLTADAWKVLRPGEIDVARAEGVVERIDARRVHRDERFAVLQLRSLDVDETVFRIVAVGPVLNRFHHPAPC